MGQRCDELCRVLEVLECFPGGWLFCLCRRYHASDCSKLSSDETEKTKSDVADLDPSERLLEQRCYRGLRVGFLLVEAIYTEPVFKTCSPGLIGPNYDMRQRLRAKSWLDESNQSFARRLSRWTRQWAGGRDERVECLDWWF